MALEKSNKKDGGGLNEEQKKSIMDLLNINSKKDNKSDGLDDAQKKSIMDLLNKNETKESGLTRNQKDSIMDLLNKNTTKDNKLGGLDDAQKKSIMDLLNKNKENSGPENQDKDIKEDESREEVSKDKLSGKDDSVEEAKYEDQFVDRSRDAIKKQAINALKSQRVGIVNVKELAEAEARKAADAYMTESKKDLKGVTGFFKKIWKHTFFDEFYRQREINRVKQQIKESDNIYVGRIKDKDRVAHEGAMKAVSGRFIADYEGLLSEGEDKKFLDDKEPEAIKAREDIKNLIINYAQGNFTEEVFKTEKIRILDNLKNQDLLKDSDNYADNLFEIAENAKLAIEHGAKIEELEFDTNIIIGKAKSSLKTEAHFNFVDKGVNWMKKTKVGRFISPAVLSTAVGIAYCVSAKFLASKGGSALLGLTGAVAFSATLAGINESQRVALERSQHGIEMAEGGEFEEGSKRREQMEKFTYQMESSSVLADSLRNLMFEKDSGGNDKIKDFNKDDLNKIFGILGDVDARNALNQKKKIDLISYSGIGGVEKERTDLAILVAKTKVELRRRLNNDLKGSLPAEETFESYLQKQTEAVENSLLGGEKGITAQDKAFKKYKAKRVAKKVLQTATLGFVIGGTIQEAFALHNDDVQGIYEGITGSNQDAMVQTPFEHIREWVNGNVDFLNSANPVETVLGGNVFHLPPGISIVDNFDGTVDIFRGDTLISDNTLLTFDADGNLDADSLARLGESGIVASTSTHVVEGVKEVTSGAKDYLANHPESASRYGRIGWYDNDTPKPIFDHNELKLWWGGEGNTGIDLDGNYRLDISQMTSDGSFHQDFSVDAQDAMKNGLLKMVFSLTSDTQNQLFEVPIGADGTINIDPDSEIGKLFFGVEDGRTIFKGRFAEVVQSFGEKDGVEQIKSLATLVGPGNNEINDIVKTVTKESIHHLDIPKGLQPPWFIPVMARRPLEKLKEIEAIPYYTGSFNNEAQLKQFEQARSETLINNPEASLDQYEEIDLYLKKLDKKYASQIEEMAKKIEKIEDKCKLSINIPVAGHQESKNIYESLKNYIHQTANRETFELVLFVNHPETDKNGKKLDAKDTLKEIERFKKDYPDLRVRVMYKAIPNKDINIGRIRKMMTDATLKRQHNRGKDAYDLILASNDADNKGIDPRYIKTFIDKFDGDKKIDGMLGQLDWDPESYQKYPAIHIGTRLFQYLSVIGRHRSNSMVSSGANSAYRASIYAGIGGYLEDVNGGEDVAIGRAIIAARNGDKKRFSFAGPGTRLFTSSRRAISVFEKYGLAPVEQWKKGFSVFDDEIRKLEMKNDGEIDYDNKEVLNKLKSSLEMVINRTLNEWESGENLGKDSPYYKKALGWLGIKYNLNSSGDIVISNMDSLIKGLKKYQKEGKLMRDSRSGKVEAKEKLSTIRKSQNEDK
jgi:hypothetical protein